MNFRDLRSQRFSSAFARWRLLFRPGRSYSVCFGPLRGMKLQYDRSINCHTILGLSDSETFRIPDRLLAKDRLLPRNSTIADIGGNVGYYSMWFAKTAGAQSVYTFEPNPDVFKILQTKIELNRLKTAVIARTTADGSTYPV
jgi:hypothetical protein